MYNTARAELKLRELPEPIAILMGRCWFCFALLAVGPRWLLESSDKLCKVVNETHVHLQDNVQALFLNLLLLELTPLLPTLQSELLASAIHHALVTLLARLGSCSLAVTNSLQLPVCISAVKT